MNHDPSVLDDLPLDVLLAPGSTVAAGGRRWEVLAVPGHGTGAVAFFEATAGLLITGDALWEDGFGVLNPWTDGLGVFDEAQVAEGGAIVATDAGRIVGPAQVGPQIRRDTGKANWAGVGLRAETRPGAQATAVAILGADAARACRATVTRAAEIEVASEVDGYGAAIRVT